MPYQIAESGALIANASNYIIADEARVENPDYRVLDMGGGDSVVYENMGVSPGGTACSDYQHIGIRPPVQGKENAIDIRIIAAEKPLGAGDQVHGTGEAGVFRQAVHPGEGILLEGRGDIDAVIARQKAVPGIVNLLEIKKFVRVSSGISGSEEPGTQRTGHGMPYDAEFHFLREKKLLCR